MSSRHQTLLTIRKRDRADAIEKLNTALQHRDQLALEIEQLEEKINQLKMDLGRPKIGANSRSGLIVELNHRDRLRQQMADTNQKVSSLNSQRSLVENEIWSAKEQVANAQKAVKLLQEKILE